jgi:hypothetical protein
MLQNNLIVVRVNPTYLRHEHSVKGRVHEHTQLFEVSLRLLRVCKLIMK